MGVTIYVSDLIFQKSYGTSHYVTLVTVQNSNVTSRHVTLVTIGTSKCYFTFDQSHVPSRRVHGKGAQVMSRHVT